MNLIKHFSSQALNDVDSYHRGTVTSIEISERGPIVTVCDKTGVYEDFILDSKPVSLAVGDFIRFKTCQNFSDVADEDLYLYMIQPEKLTGNVISLDVKKKQQGKPSLG